jgi:hypothetical protein
VTLSECARDPRVRGSVDLIAIARGRSATRRSQSGGPAEARAARAPNERAPGRGRSDVCGRARRADTGAGRERAGQRRADHVTSAGACGVAAQGALMLSIGRDGARPTGRAWERPDEQPERGAQRQRRQMVEEPCRPKAELGHGRTNGRTERLSGRRECRRLEAAHVWAGPDRAEDRTRGCRACAGENRRRQGAAPPASAQPLPRLAGAHRPRPFLSHPPARRAMANYLPLLLVSVNATVVVDDTSLGPTLPRGQVDYLSHRWREEDVWRSWRDMTRRKNEIANGARLENASWRTWWKQRNKLKTVSPETLNW